MTTITMPAWAKYKLCLLLFLFSGLSGINVFASDRNGWFTENKGQIIDQYGRQRTDVKFIYALNDFKLILKADGFSYELMQSLQNSSLDEATLDNDFPEEDALIPDVNEKISINRIDVTFLDCNQHIIIDAQESAIFYQNFYHEHTGLYGITKVRSFKKIVYRDIYPGIDLVFSITDDGLKKPEYSFILRPGSDVKKIQMMYSKSGKNYLNDNGELCMTTKNGSITESKPVSFYQDDPQQFAPVNFSLQRNMVSFEVPRYDREHTLIIDPVISWATYYGGKKSDMPDEIVISNTNDVFVTGRTDSKEMIATTGSYQVTFGGGGNEDAFLVKFDPDGNLLWATYYGGQKTELGYSMCKDYEDNIYLCGRSNSVSGIASVNAYQPVYGGGDHDGYIAKFNSDGILQWSTYYGGTGIDRILACTTDQNKILYVTGYTESPDGIATPGAYKTVANTKGDVFISKFSPDGGIFFGTYFGGPGQDRGHSIAVDDWGNIVTIGTTTSKSEISLPGAMQKKYAGSVDMYLTKLTNDGMPIWSTYYGGTKDDRGRACATDAAGNIFILAQVESTDIKTTPETFKPVLVPQANNDEDAFIAKFDSSGNRLWATYFGGNIKEQPKTLKTDRYGSVIYISGSTKSTEGLSTPGAFQKFLGGANDAFFARINHNATMLMYASYYGGKKSESDFNHTWYGAPMDIDYEGNIILASPTMSMDSIAYGNAYRTTLATDTAFDFFVAKFIEDCFDSYENNDALSLAPRLFFDGTANSRMVRGTLQTTSDVDYYLFPLAASLGNIRCSVSGLTTNHTLTIYNSNQIAVATINGSSNVNAVVVLNGAVPGNYYVGITSGSGSSFNSPLCYHINIETSASPFKYSEEGIIGSVLTLHPNPATGTVTISLPENFGENSVLRLISLTGRVMAEQQLNGNELFFKINLEHLPAGQYLVNVSNRNHVWTEKLIKE